MKKERSKISNLPICLKELKKEKSKLRKKLLEVILDKLYLIYVKHMIKRAKIQDPNTRTKFDIL